MEVTEIIRLKNLPNDIKIVEALLSSAHGEVRARNPDSSLNYIEIKFILGTPQKELVREVK